MFVGAAKDQDPEQTEMKSGTSDPRMLPRIPRALVRRLVTPFVRPTM